MHIVHAREDLPQQRREDAAAQVGLPETVHTGTVMKMTNLADGVVERKSSETPMSRWWKLECLF
jgi:hypothetical protein